MWWQILDIYFVFMEYLYFSHPLSVLVFFWFVLFCVLFNYFKISSDIEIISKTKLVVRDQWSYIKIYIKKKQVKDGLQCTCVNWKLETKICVSIL